MKILKRIVYLLDRLEDFMVFAACLVLMMIGMYSLYDGYLTYQHANDDSLLKYKPGYEKESEVEKDFQGNLFFKNFLFFYPVFSKKTHNIFRKRL